MNDNVGAIIKGWSKTLGWLCLILGGFVWGFLMLDGYDSWYGYSFNTDNNYIAWIALAAGLSGYLSSHLTYAFGQLVDDVHALRNHAVEPAAQNDDLPEL